MHFIMHVILFIYRQRQLTGCEWKEPLSSCCAGTGGETAGERAPCLHRQLLLKSRALHRAERAGIRGMWDSPYKSSWSATGHKEEFGQRGCLFGGHGQQHGGTEVGRQRQVSMLSTLHNDSMVTKTRQTRLAEGGREEVRKPVMVEQYNKYMGVVDKSDHLLSY